MNYLRPTVIGLLALAALSSGGAIVAEGSSSPSNERQKQQDVGHAREYEKHRNFGPSSPVRRVSAQALPVDTDDDGMPDAWELANGLNPNNPDDAWLDPDGDQVVNLFEYQLGSALNSAATPPVATVASSGADYTDVETAIDAVAPGTTIRVAGGTYPVNYLTFSPMVVMIQGGWSSDFSERHLDLNPTTFDGGLQDEVLYFSPFSGESAIVLDGLHFVRGNGFFGAVNLLASGTASMKTSIVNSSIIESGNASGFGGVLEMHNWDASQSDRTIANTLIAGNTASGIYSQNTEQSTAHWRIINSTISHNLNGGGFDGKGIDSFTLDDGNLTAHVYNSILWGNEGADLEIHSNITFHVDRSDVGNVSAILGASYLPGSGVVNVDPQFIQPNSGDFQVRANSPVIDAGIDVGIPLIDLEGNPRIRGGAVDLGAYEFQSTFADVSSGHWASKYIEALSDAGITTGCATDPLRYCPNSPVTRAQMAAFLLRAMGHADHLPSYKGYFSDVPSGLWYTGFVEHLFEHGVTGGCATSPLRYCPSDSVNRAAMAAFLLRGIDEADHLPAYQDYFDDVGAGLWFTGFVEHLFEHTVTLGCSASPPLYCPFSAVTRAQMAAFIVRAFELLPP